MYLGIDPGEKTGIVFVKNFQDRQVVDHFLLGNPILKSPDLFTYLAKKFDYFISNFEVDVIVMEDYDERLYGNFFTVKLIGAVEAFAAQKDIPVITAYPSQTKMVSDLLIKEFFDHNLVSHERDALRAIVACREDLDAV